MPIKELMPTKKQADEIRSAMRTHMRIQKYFDPCSYNEVIAFIMGAIRLGRRTREEIIGCISDMCREENWPIYLGQTIDQFTGDDPEHHCWFKDQSGRYHLLH